MIITKKAIPRRTVLRGMGAALALPLLDGMVPALTALQKTAARPIRRLGIIYSPNGMVMPSWTPTKVGADFELSPILQPLAPYRDRLLVISGLANRQADSQGDGSGDHARGGGGYLTGIHVTKSEGVLGGGISMDQIAARSLQNETQLSSLELSLDANDVVGSCDLGYSCAYTNTISWRTPTMPLIAENDPRAVFERLFGASDSTDPKVRMARLRQNRSVLDVVTERISVLRGQLGESDKTKLTDYLDAVRDVERRIQLAEEQSTRSLPTVDRPGGVPDMFEDHAKMMYDLQVLAYQCDLTRVITFMIGRELSPRTYPQLGVPDPWHGLSHHANDAEKLAKLALVQTHNVNLFGYYLEKLQATADGDGTLLDHTMLLYGAGLSNSDRHYHHDLPVLLAGGGAGAIKGGRHLQYAADTPLANLHVTLLDNMGVRTDGLGNSSGKCPELSELSSGTAA